MDRLVEAGLTLEQAAAVASVLRERAEEYRCKVQRLRDEATQRHHSADIWNVAAIELSIDADAIERAAIDAEVTP